MACLLLLLLLLSPYFTATTLAQDEPPPEDEEPIPSPSPTTEEPVVPTSTVAPSPPAATSAAPTMPDPIFSNSESCTQCKPQWPSLQTCQSYLPPSSVNLTVITAVLPFYSCICKNDMVLIDSLVPCANCFRGTSQLAFLHPMFYGVSQANHTRAFKEICTQTKDGTTVPPDNAAVSGLLPPFRGASAWVMAMAMMAVGSAFLI
ncbi:hypothetical protein BGZ73_009192 [Actinomortierella ambigua]|nr:hypothetical protein BGZ73_009192 [Actinomortierella ambigua]